MLKKNIDLTTFLLSFVAVVLLSCLQKVRCDGIVQVKLLNYTNTGGLKDTGTCCDTLAFGICEPGGGCDTQFYIGIDDVSNPARDNYTAFKYGFAKTGYTADQSDIDYHLLTDLGREVVNPITYNFTSSWPGRVMMKVQAWDHELIPGLNAEKIDFMQSVLTLSAALATNQNVPWTSERIMNRTTMWMNVRVFCGANWYGDQCNVLCISGNRYTCGADGSKICSGGWTGSDCNTADSAGQVTAADGGQEVTDPVLVTDASSDQVTDAAAAANDCGGGCQNSGSCIGGSCSCLPGFTGENCETDIDECAGVECNGGTCVDLTNRFTCQCPIGLTGDACQVVEEGCENNPCRNGGTCQVIDHVVYCSCATGWTGSRCNADIDECSTKMCRNSIGCLNTDGAFVCTCQFGWIGPLCDVKINLVTSRFSKRSVWTFRGKLSDDEILRIVNRIIILIARSGSGGSQSTSSVLVYYEVRFLNSESSREAKTILFLRVNSGGEPIPVETLTTLAKGPYKSEISSSLMSAEDDTGDSTSRNLMLSTSRTSQGSVWTLRGTLSDDEILLILNRVINAVTATGAGGSQSTSSVLVYYEVRFFNSESPQEAKTILLLRVNSGGNRIPMGTLTALANGPSKSEISPSLMSAEDDDGDNTATDLRLSTSRLSKISVWTFQGKLLDDDILRILNLVITRITSTGSGGSQSTSSVIVYYEVRFLNSVSPREAKTILLLRVNRGGEPVPMQNLTALANGPFKSEISSSLMSAENDNGANTARDISLRTLRISKRSVWTFQGKLSDNEILGILNRVITTVTATGSGGSQSTIIVLVDYEVRFLNADSPLEARTILLLRLNSAGELIPIETLTALANGPSKSQLSSSLLSADNNNGERDHMLVTSRISKRSVWTFRGKLSDADIVSILNLVITRITSTVSGGSQSTINVIVYYEVRFLNSESPREVKTILFLRVNSGGEPIPMETLTALANGPSKSEISSSLLSAEDDNGDSTSRNLMLSTSRTSQGSVWTLRGTLSDDEILLILNRVITIVTGADYGGSQSTSSVLVYYEVRFLNSQSLREAKTILLLRVNSGGEPIPMQNLTALANGAFKSNLSSSLMSAEDDDRDNTATDLTLSTSRISKISVWTFQGKLSDDDILRILNLVITRITSTGSGGSQSTSSVIVYYEVRFLNSESPGEAKTILLLRVNSGGEPIPMETLTALANGPSKSELSSSLMSAEDGNEVNTARDISLSTSRISKRSAWTFGGKLSDNEIMGILNRVITTVTSIGSGGSQSTKSVLVDYEVRYVNSESPREAKTILLLRLNSGGKPVPMETLTALANGPSKSLLYSSLMSAETDNGDSDLMIVTSKRSVWTFQGKLSDAEIVDILNLVITKITATGSGGNQSTSSVIVYYKFRYLNSESPRDSKTILLLRVNRGGEPIPMETLTALANGPSKSEISSSLLSAEDDNGVNTEGETQGQTQLQLEPSELERRLDIGAIIVISFIIIGVIIGIILVCIRKPRQRWEFETQQKDPFEMPEATKEQSFEEGECGGLGTGEQDNDRYTTDGSDLQPTAPNIYVIKGHGHDQKGQNKGSSSSSSSKNSSYVNVPADVKRKK